MTLLNLITNKYPCNLYEVRQTNFNVSFPVTPPINISNPLTALGINVYAAVVTGDIYKASLI